MSYSTITLTVNFLTFFFVHSKTIVRGIGKLKCHFNYNPSLKQSQLSTIYDYVLYNRNHIKRDLNTPKNILYIIILILFVGSLRLFFLCVHAYWFYYRISLLYINEFQFRLEFQDYYYYAICIV